MLNRVIQYDTVPFSAVVAGFKRTIPCRIVATGGSTKKQEDDMTRLDNLPRTAVQARHHHHGWWWKALIAGTALWVVTAVVTALTRNSNLVPTLILLGSFLVPFCVVLFVMERVTGSISSLQLILAFFVGGIFGVLGASLLEAELTQSDWWVYTLVGLIEEFVKGALVVIFGWRVTPKTAMQGALLGATIGAGFAAFESAGYAFNAAITARGIDLISLLETELTRAVLAPVGHVLWTAILGAVIFGSAHLGTRFRWSWWIALAYLASATLHAMWDSSSELASFLALVLNGQAVQELQHGFLLPRVADQVSALTTVLYVVLLAITSLIGFSILFMTLRHYRRAARGWGAPA